MKYYRLYIHTDGTQEVFDRITILLQLPPTLTESTNSDNSFGLWMYCVDEDDDEPYFDFINVFLDTIDQHMDNLQLLGISKSDITFWLIYEYDQQCAMEFHPAEMARLGKSGITLCIDCFQTSKCID